MKKELSLNEFLMKPLLKDELKTIEKLIPSFFKGLNNDYKEKIKIIDILVVFASENKLKLMPIIYDWTDMLSLKGKEDFGAFILNSLFKKNNPTFNKVVLACLTKSMVRDFQEYSSYSFSFKKMETLSVFLNGLYDEKGEVFLNHWSENVLSSVENIGPYEMGMFAKFFKDIDMKVHKNKEKWNTLIEKSMLEVFSCAQDRTSLKSPFLTYKLSEDECSAICYLYENYDCPKDKKEALVIKYMNELKEDYVKGHERKCTLNFLNFFYKNQLSSGNDMFYRNKESLQDLENVINRTLEIKDLPGDNSFTVNIKHIGFSLIVSLTTYAPELTDRLYPYLKKHKFSKSDLNMSSVLMSAIKKVINNSYPENIINIEYSKEMNESINDDNNYNDCTMKVNITCGNKNIGNGIKNIMEDVFLSYNENYVIHRDSSIEKIGSIIEYHLMKKDVLENEEKTVRKVRKF